MKIDRTKFKFLFISFSLMGKLNAIEAPQEQIIITAGSIQVDSAEIEKTDEDKKKQKEECEESLTVLWVQ